MGKNVMIPVSLFERIIDLLVCLEPSEYHELCYEYGNILWMLRVKQQKLKLRDSYAKIIAAEEQTERDEARLDYLRLKSDLKYVRDDIF